MLPSNRELNGYSESLCTSRLELPGVAGSPVSEEDVLVELDEPADVYHLLSDKVRKEYVTYLEKLLHSNYETWMICSPSADEQRLNWEDLNLCAKTLELEAVKSSMIVSLYRKAMLKIISEVRLETKGQRLISRLAECHSGMRTKCNAETQTEQFERDFTLPGELPDLPDTPSPPRKKRRSAKKRRKTPPRPEAEETMTKDEIEENLEKLFATEANELDIFETADDPHIKVVLSETNHPPAGVQSPQLIVEEQQDTLKDSIWPCELRMRRRKLFQIMCTVGDSSLRSYERLKLVFQELFGEDSDDEEAPLSPADDMDAATLSSCRKRIAPLIVKQLMKPFSQGLIANRWLFKKLAKSLADSIVLVNDYPDERFVRNHIDEYFAIHPRIADASDIA